MRGDPYEQEWDLKNSFFSSCSKCAWHRTNLEQQVLRARFLGLIFYQKSDERIEPGTAGWEAQTLPLCYAVPQDLKNIMNKGSIFSQKNFFIQWKKWTLDSDESIEELETSHDGWKIDDGLKLGEFWSNNLIQWDLNDERKPPSNIRRQAKSPTKKSSYR